MMCPLPQQIEQVTIKVQNVCCKFAAL